MSKPNVTPRFPADVDPVHLGWYETRMGHDHDIEMRRYVGKGAWIGICTNGVTEYQSTFGVMGGISIIRIGEAWRGLQSPHGQN